MSNSGRSGSSTSATPKNTGATSAPQVNNAVVRVWSVLVFMCISYLCSLPFLRPLECGVDRHGVTMAQPVVLLEPANDFHRLDAGLQQPLLLSKLLEVFGRFPGLCFDVVDVGLK